MRDARYAGLEPPLGGGFRPPFLALSVLAHAALFWWLSAATFGTLEAVPGAVGSAARPAQLAQVKASMRRTEVAELQKHVRRLEAVKRELDASLGAPPRPSQDAASLPREPAALAAQAQRLSDAIQASAREQQARQLASLLRVPERDARKMVLAQERRQAEQAKRAERIQPSLQPNMQPATAQLAHQAALADKALRDVRRALDRQRNGVALDMSRDAGAAVHRGDRAGAAPAAASGSGLGNLNGDGRGQENVNGSGNGGGSGRGRGNGGQPSAGAGRDDAHGAGGIPHIDGAAHRVRATTIGPGGEFGSRILLDSWHIIGPFAGNLARNYAANPVYPPERAVLLDAVYEGKGGRLLRWEPVKGARYPITPPILSEDAVYYAYTDVRMDTERDMWVWLGGDDHIRLWVNDELAYAGDPSDKLWFFHAAHGNDQQRLIKDWNLTETRRLVRFRKGVNRMLVKLSNGPKYVFFSVVLTPK